MKNLTLTSLLFLITQLLFAQDSYRTLIYPDDNVELPNYTILPPVAATCFCVVSYNDLTNLNTRSGVALDLTSRVNLKFTGINQQSKSNRNKCNRVCTAKASSLSSSDYTKIAKAACNANRPSGTAIRAFSSVGTKAYRTAQHVGRLENVPAQTTNKYFCPTGWKMDDWRTNINRKCNKKLCDLDQAGNAFSNQEYGDAMFVWEGSVYQWKRASIESSVTKPGICRIIK